MNQFKAKRIGKDLTQEEVANLIGISNRTVSMWETGSAFPRLKTLIKLAAVLDCRVDDLLREEGSNGE